MKWEQQLYRNKPSKKARVGYNERYCYLCKENYMATTGGRKYCLQCQKIMQKEYQRRTNQKHYRREKLLREMKNKILAMGFQAYIENHTLIVSQPPNPHPLQG
jgi:hypothetical protein